MRTTVVLPAVTGLLATDIPLMFAAAELDLSFFHQQLGLMKGLICESAKGCARSVLLPQHSHMSEVYAINTKVDWKPRTDEMIWYKEMSLV